MVPELICIVGCCQRWCCCCCCCCCYEGGRGRGRGLVPLWHLRCWGLPVEPPKVPRPMIHLRTSCPTSPTSSTPIIVWAFRLTVPHPSTLKTAGSSPAAPISSSPSLPSSTASTTSLLVSSSCRSRLSRRRPLWGRSLLSRGRGCCCCCCCCCWPCWRWWCRWCRRWRWRCCCCCCCCCWCCSTCLSGHCGWVTSVVCDDTFFEA